MGMITDILKGLPLNVVLRDKLQQLEKKYDDLEAENNKLNKENRNLKDEIENLKAPSLAGHLQDPTCPHCSTTGRPFYMSPVPKDFVEFENATHECSHCKYKTRVVSSPADAL